MHVVPGRSVKGDSSLGKRTITWGWGEEVEFISSTRCSNVPGTFIRPGERTWVEVVEEMWQQQCNMNYIMSQRAVVVTMGVVMH